MAIKIGLPFSTQNSTKTTRVIPRSSAADKNVIYLLSLSVIFCSPNLMLMFAKLVLQFCDKFQGVTGNNPVVVVGCRQKHRRVLTAILKNEF